MGIQRESYSRYYKLRAIGPASRQSCAFHHPIGALCPDDTKRYDLPRKIYTNGANPVAEFGMIELG